MPVCWGAGREQAGPHIPSVVAQNGAIRSEVLQPQPHVRISRDSWRSTEPGRRVLGSDTPSALRPKVFGSWELALEPQGMGTSAPSTVKSHTAVAHRPSVPPRYYRSALCPKGRASEGLKPEQGSTMHMRRRQSHLTCFSQPLADWNSSSPWTPSEMGEWAWGRRKPPEELAHVLFGKYRGCEPACSLFLMDVSVIKMNGDQIAVWEICQGMGNPAVS